MNTFDEKKTDWADRLRLKIVLTVATFKLFVWKFAIYSDARKIVAIIWNHLAYFRSQKWILNCWAGVRYSKNFFCTFGVKKSSHINWDENLIIYFLHLISQIPNIEFKFIEMKSELFIFSLWILFKFWKTHSDDYTFIYRKILCSIQ